MSLNRNSSPEDKRGAADVVYEYLSDYFFDGVTFINLVYSDLGSGGTTSTTDFGKLSRIIDSSGGVLMGPDKRSRMRCQFYVKAPSKTIGYILSPAVYDAWALPSSLTDMSVFRSYAGIKIDRGELYFAVKGAGQPEKLYPLDFELTMSDATFTNNFSLELRYNGLSTDLLLDGAYVGSYSTDLVGSFDEVFIFYPFFAPAKSSDGTQVNIVAENIQFIQPRNL